FVYEKVTKNNSFGSIRFSLKYLIEIFKDLYSILSIELAVKEKSFKVGAQCFPRLARPLCGAVLMQLH
ncbi:hypothetical protein, partial [Escherichia coli]|uniref:hypothetical protein n=1 Tax=Escherichia coli TaxID=562 RepID=UPI000AE53029